MRTDFQFSKVKNSGDRCWWELHNDVNVLIATELYSYIWLKYFALYYGTLVAVQLLSHVWLFVTLWTAARQASLSLTNSWSLLKLMSMELVMPSHHLILCHPLLLLPPIFPSIRVFSNELALFIGCTIGSRKYCRTGEYSQYSVITVNGK